MTMLASNQNPERVLNILRSSTRTTRPRGTGAKREVCCSRTVGIAVAVMLLSSLCGCLAGCLQ